MCKYAEANKKSKEARVKQAAIEDDLITIKQQLNEVLKTNEILADENERSEAALEELERAHAARLKAEELAKCQAEKIQRLENELEEAYAKIKEKDDELIFSLEKEILSKSQGLGADDNDLLNEMMI